MNNILSNGFAEACNKEAKWFQVLQLNIFSFKKKQAIGRLKQQSPHCCWQECVGIVQHFFEKNIQLADQTKLKKWEIPFFWICYLIRQDACYFQKKNSHICRDQIFDKIFVIGFSL